MNGIYLLLGSNVGDRLENLKKASSLLIERKIQTIEESSIYETSPWGVMDQGWFLNIVLEVQTTYLPEILLQEILSVETMMGRERKEKWGERLIDIDILYYKDQVVGTEDLIIPHPGIPERRFVLVPMAELNPFADHPTLKKNQLELLADCKDDLDCIKTAFKL